MNLNLADKLILIALDDEKGTFNFDSLTFEYGLAGAAIYELFTQQKIEIVDKKVKLHNARPTKDEALNYCLKKIQESKKERSIKYWIDYFGNRGSNIRKPILKKLISLGILTEKESKILWVIPNNKYPTKNQLPENEIKARLKAIVLGHQEPELDEIMLISLIDSCKLNNQAYGKKIAKEQQDKIKGIISDSKLADSTHKILKEIHDTIIAALVVIFATTAITTST